MALQVLHQQDELLGVVVGRGDTRARVAVEEARPVAVRLLQPLAEDGTARIVGLGVEPPQSSLPRARQLAEETLGSFGRLVLREEDLPDLPDVPIVGPEPALVVTERLDDSQEPVERPQTGPPFSRLICRTFVRSSVSRW